MSVEGQIAHVTLNRPDKLNAFDLDMLDALVATGHGLRRNRSIRGVLLSGRGTTFSSGLDFSSTARQPRRTVTSFIRPPWRTTNRFQEACWAWRRIPVPVVAVIEGHCYGAGMQLALAADFRFTRPETRFSVMESAWGLVPDMSGTVTLRELVPIDIAKRLMMTAEVLDGNRAHALGLVTEVSENPWASAHELLEQISSRSPDAIAIAKRLCHETWGPSPAPALRTERRSQLRLLLGRNHRIVRAARSAGTSPTFVPRTLK